MPTSKHIAAVLLVVAVLVRTLQQGSLTHLLDALQVSNNEKYPLQGNFAPVNQTMFTICLKPTEGKIPVSLQGGMFARVGPNPFQPEKHYHWFDGQGMIHAVKLGESCVNYTNEWMNTPRMQKEAKLGWNSHLRLGNMRGIIGMIRVLVIAPLYDLLGFSVNDQLRNGVANTALVFHHGVLNSLVENNLPWQVKIEQDGHLTSKEHFSFNNKWPYPTSAHIKNDLNSDELILFGYQIQKKPYVVTGVANAKGELISGPVPIDIANPVMMHDCAISEHYTIIMDLPFVFDPLLMPKGSPFVFRSDLKSRFGLQPRHAKNQTEIKWFTALPCFVFHTANAWEEKTASGEDLVVLVALRYANMTLDFGEMTQRSAEPNDLYEWRFNLHTGLTSERKLEGMPAGEFPVVNRNFLGRKARYTYFPTSATTAHEFPKLNGVAKVDLSTGTLLHHQLYGSGIFGGELTFVPGQSDEEDDGYLTGFIHDEIRGVSSLIVLNARTFKQETRVELPGRVPYGFHGTFITSKELAN